MNKRIQSRQVQEVFQTNNLLPVYTRIQSNQKSFQSVGDLFKLTTTQLMNTLDMSQSEVSQLMEFVCTKFVSFEESNGFMLKEQIEKHLPSGLKTLDECFCGGFPRGVITEIAGPSASGKSTFCFTLMLQCLFELYPLSDDQNTAKILYLDTERKFDSKVLADMLRNYTLDNALITKVLQSIEHVQIPSLLDCIKYMDNSLDEYIIEHDVKMIVIDSVFTVAKTADHHSRDQLLGSLAARLKQMAREFSLHVFVTNNYRMQRDGRPDRGAELGLMWSHAVNIRLVLDKQFITIDKSPLCAPHTIAYKVDGIIQSAEADVYHKNDTLETPPNKK